MRKENEDIEDEKDNLEPPDQIRVEGDRAEIVQVLEEVEEEQQQQQQMQNPPKQKDKNIKRKRQFEQDLPGEEETIKKIPKKQEQEQIQISEEVESVIEQEKAIIEKKQRVRRDVKKQEESFLKKRGYIEFIGDEGEDPIQANKKIKTGFGVPELNEHRKELIQGLSVIMIPENEREQARYPVKLKKPDKKYPVGVVQSRLKHPNPKTVDNYNLLLRNQIISGEMIPIIDNFLPLTVDEAQIGKKLKNRINLVQQNGGVNQKVELEMSRQEYREQLIKFTDTYITNAPNLEDFNFDYGTVFDERIFGEGVFPVGNLVEEHFVNLMYQKIDYGENQERILVYFFAQCIRQMPAYMQAFDSDELLSTEFFSFFNQSDNLKRRLNIGYEFQPNQRYTIRLDEQPDIFEYKNFVKMCINFSMIDCQQCYNELQTLQQDGTNPPKLSDRFNSLTEGVSQFRSCLGRPSVSDYITHGISLERFAGRLSVSKRHCMFVLWSLYALIKWVRGQEWYQPEKMTILERMFVPQSYDDVTSTVIQNLKIKYEPFGVGQYFTILVSDALNNIRQQLRQKDFQILSELHTEQTSAAQVVYEGAGMDRIFPRDPQQLNAGDLHQHAAVRQSLDISNVFTKQRNQLGMQTRALIGNPLFNSECLQGLIQALKTNIDKGGEQKQNHYIQFILRVFCQSVARDEDLGDLADLQRAQNQRFRVLCYDDLEFQGQEFSRTHWIHRTGNFILTDAQAQQFLDFEDDQYSKIFNAVFEIIATNMRDMSEKYGWEDDQVDFTRSQITEFRVTSIFDEVFKFVVPQGFSIQTSPMNISMFIREQPEAFAITEANELKIMPFYFPIEEYTDTPLIHCVEQTFGFIWLKEVQKKEIILAQDFIHYRQSDFYKKNYQILNSKEVIPIYALFVEKVCKNIVLAIPQLKMLYDKPLSAKYIIKFMYGHCWLDKKTVENKENQNQLRTVYKLKQKVKKIKKNKQAPAVNKNATDVRINIFYDIETYCQEITIQRKNKKVLLGQKQIPYLLSFEMRSSLSPDQLDKKSFYGEGCCVNFVDFLFKLTNDNAKNLNSKFKYYIFAHNGHSFDNVFLFPILLDYWGDAVQYAGSTSNFKFLSITCGIQFIDTRNLIPGKLAQAAKDFQTEHQKLDFDVKHTTKEQVESQEFQKQATEYCEQDVTVLREVYYKFLETMKGIVDIKEDDLGATIASTALKIYRKFYFPEEVQEVYGNAPNVEGIQNLKYERISYFGGVCTIWDYNKVEKGSLYYDFVSMYPSILATELYPISQGVYSHVNKLKKEKRFFKDRTLYIITAFKFKDDTFCPNLPVRSEVTKNSIYCKEFKQDEKVEVLAYWGEEIQLAFDMGLIEIQVKAQIQYEHSAILFKKYIDAFFLLKKNSEEGPIKAMAKLLLNSLYGKFGQLPQGKKKIYNKRLFNVMGANNFENQRSKKQNLYQYLYKKDGVKQGKYIKFIQSLNQELIEVEFNPCDVDLNYCGSLVRLASFTTMKGRNKLFSIINALHQENVVVYYCDTDSVCCAPCNMQRIEQHSTLVSVGH